MTAVRPLPNHTPAFPICIQSLAAFRVVAVQAESAYQALGFTCRFLWTLRRVENAWGVFGTSVGLGQSDSSLEVRAGQVCTPVFPLEGDPGTDARNRHLSASDPWCDDPLAAADRPPDQTGSSKWTPSQVPWTVHSGTLL